MMQGVKVGEKKGFVIAYDARRKLFLLYNANDDEVGSGGKQEDVEKQADKLAKLRFQFPIPAFTVNGVHVEEGKVTSLNVDDQSIWVVLPSKYGGSRSKARLSYCHIHEATERNKEVVEKIATQVLEMDKKREEIEALVATLDKRINLEYFGLKVKSYY